MFRPARKNSQCSPSTARHFARTLAERSGSVPLLFYFDQKTGRVLSQMQVPIDTNEAKAALPIFNTSVLEGCVVTRWLSASTCIAPFLNCCPGLQQVVSLERTTKWDGKTTTEVQYVSTSLFFHGEEPKRQRSWAAGRVNGGSNTDSLGFVAPSGK